MILHRISRLLQTLRTSKISKILRTSICHRKRDGSIHSHHSPQDHSWNHSHSPGHQSHQCHSQGHHSSCRSSSSLCLRFRTWCAVEGEFLENECHFCARVFIVFLCRYDKPQQRDNLLFENTPLLRNNIIKPYSTYLTYFQDKWRQYSFEPCFIFTLKIRLIYWTVCQIMLWDFIGYQAPLVLDIKLL